MDLFTKVQIFEPLKVHTFELNIRLISLFSLMLNYAKPRVFPQITRFEILSFRMRIWELLELQSSFCKIEFSIIRVKILTANMCNRVNNSIFIKIYDFVIITGNNGRYGGK